MAGSRSGRRRLPLRSPRIAGRSCDPQDLAQTRAGCQAEIIGGRIGGARAGSADHELGPTATTHRCDAGCPMDAGGLVRARRGRRRAATRALAAPRRTPDWSGRKAAQTSTACAAGRGRTQPTWGVRRRGMALAPGVGSTLGHESTATKEGNPKAPEPHRTSSGHLNQGRSGHGLILPQKDHGPSTVGGGSGRAAGVGTRAPPPYA